MFTSVVPPNAARYLGTKVLARRVPVAHLELMPPRSGTRYYFNDLKKDEMLGIILSNKSFDSSLIKYDSNYFTTTSCDEANQVSLLKLVMAIKPSIKNAFEIGCGQGEFVELLRKSGIDATGCDPVFRGCQPGITATTFEQSPQQHSNLFILRCVLPHLERPFELIDKIFELNPQSQILFTFPNISWIFKTGTWASLSHDHVHYFSLSEIGRRYQLLRGGKYSAGEWSFCLIRSQNFQLQNRALNPDPEKVEVLREKFRQLQSKKDRFMKSIELEKRRIVIWGGLVKELTSDYTLVYWA